MPRAASAAARQALPPAAEAPVEGDPREGAMEGVLAASGRLGYRGASVRAILEYSGGHRAQFYRHFKSKEDCFAQAYSTWIDRLSIGVLEAAASAPGWQDGIRAALVSLFRFVNERPMVARALFVEVQIAGGPALAKREETMSRFAQAIDSVRAEIDPGVAPPETAGLFVVGGIEACIGDALANGEPERVWDGLPELMHLAVGSYLGLEAASAAFEDALAFLERTRPATEGEG